MATKICGGQMGFEIRTPKTRRPVIGGLVVDVDDSRDHHYWTVQVHCATCSVDVGRPVMTWMPTDPDGIARRLSGAHFFYEATEHARRFHPMQPWTWWVPKAKHLQEMPPA